MNPCETGEIEACNLCDTAIHPEYLMTALTQREQLNLSHALREVVA